ncbi:MAG: ABC transporter permease [Chitinophagaceae bacterium]
MNVATFIAGRIAFNRQKSFSRFIIRLATAATALSVAAMIVTVCFVNGFQNAISQKVFSFWGHLRVQEYEPSKAILAEETPIVTNDSIVQILHNNPQIAHYQPFATKSAVLEKKKEIEGLLIKGVDKSYGFNNLAPFLKAGRWLQFDTARAYSRDIVISQPIANELNIKVGDSANVYFISGESTNTVARRMYVCGIYKTGIEEYDKLFAIADIRLIQKVSGWDQGMIGGYEVILKDYRQMYAVSDELYNELPDAWISRTVRDVYPSIFDWLDIQDVNRNVVFVVMSIVAVINLITCLLILVLERTQMSGVLQALGAPNFVLQRIFLYYAAIIALRGILYGFVVGVGLCLLQQYTGLLKLDESSYYVSVAPVSIVWWQILAICVVTFLVCFLALVLPAYFVKSVKPVKAIAFN